MLVHTCCCIFIFMMLGVDQILKEFEFKLKLGLKIYLRKYKRKIYLFISFPWAGLATTSPRRPSLRGQAMRRSLSSWSR